MTPLSKALLLAGLTLALLAGVVVVITVARIGVPWTPLPVTLEGSVLSQNIDPGERTPLPGVKVVAVGGSKTVVTKSDPTGYFSLTLNPGVRKGETVTLTFRKPGFKNLKINTVTPGDQLYIAQMQPLRQTSEASPDHAAAPVKITAVKNVRVRYTSKEASTMAVGSIAKRFAALNTENVPCRNQQPCSPDGKWKATMTTLPLDAELGNEFHNVRVSCIAGPCHFTKIDSADLARPARQITVSILNWSDTTEFLVDADIIRAMLTDIVRQAYPFVLGDTMSFALPSSAEGPSIEADLDGSYIVFPLGPDLILSWATCSKEVSADGNKLYRCRLKPEYRFQD
jgi:hypothetical protein